MFNERCLRSVFNERCLRSMFNERCLRSALAGHVSRTFRLITEVVDVLGVGGVPGEDLLDDDRCGVDVSGLLTGRVVYVGTTT